ncbi:MAG TPA: hypothetical protein VHC86_16245 [Opitutaceae bacterium]|nr:hypothetical protein [Opitutaceae bacterium]
MDRPGRGYGLLLASLVAAFALLRLACARGDLWLDEIWSLRLVAQVRHPWQILTSIRHDNNHPLNSLFLYLVGPGAPPWAYRLLSCAAGSASVWLAADVGRRQFARLHPGALRAGAQAAGLASAVLCGGSYLLVLYGSEARGYAPALACALAAYWALLRARARPALWRGVYLGACLLGLLAHAVAFQVIAAGAIASLAARGDARSACPGRWRDLASWHLLPLAGFAAYYLLYLRPMNVGGGTFLGGAHAPVPGVLGDAAAYALGLPDRWGWALAAPLAGLAALAALALLWRREPALAAGLAAGIFAAPLPGALLGGESVLYPRYFILSAAGVLLLLGYLAGRLWLLGAAARAACLVLLAAFLAGNAVPLARLAAVGRGQYREALRYVLRRTPRAQVSVSCDFSDFRNGMVIGYDAPAVTPAGRSLRYVPAGRWRSPGPDWIFTERLDHEPPPPERIYDAYGTLYQLERTFPHAPLSGWTWYLYRNTLALGFAGR